MCIHICTEHKLLANPEYLKYRCPPGGTSAHFTRGVLRDVLSLGCLQ